MYEQQEFKFEKKVYHRHWCDWCCRRFMATTPKRFCGKGCTWAWMKAKDRRQQSEQSE